MGDALLDHLREVVPHAGEGAGHEAGPEGHGHGHGIEGNEATPSAGHGSRSLRGTWGWPALGEPVYLVVVNQHGQIHVPAHRSHEVVSALPVHAAVAAFRDDHEPDWPAWPRWPPEALPWRPLKNSRGGNGAPWPPARSRRRRGPDAEPTAGRPGFLHGLRMESSAAGAPELLNSP